MQTDVFTGLKVVDFSRYIAGPLVSAYLAYYGATVVKVESSLRPDGLRISPPYKDGIPQIDGSGYFAYLNASKLSLAVNLKHPRGLDVARRVVAWADVAIENFTPGTMESLGLGYDDLKTVKPDIIMLRTSNQGITGPNANQPAFGHHLVGLCGYCHITGWPDRLPQAMGIAYTDVLAPRLSAAALIVALHQRRKTGKGQLIDAAQLESSTHFQAPVILDYTVNGRVQGRTGNDCPSAAPHGAYPCKGTERWCAIAVTGDEEWRSFCQAIDRPELADDSRFATLLARKRHQAELDRLVAEWTVSRAPEEVTSILQASGVPAGPVENAPDLLADPQLVHREAFWYTEHAVIGKCAHPGSFFKMSRTPAQLRSPAPLIGQHSELVCREFLGMSDEEFAELLVEGVLE